MTQRERPELYRSRSKDTGQSVRVGVYVTPEWLEAAQTALFDIPGRPFLSVQGLIRHALAVGLEHVMDNGVPEDPVRELGLLADRAGKMLRAQQYVNGLVDHARDMMSTAETEFQKGYVRDFIKEAARGCKDPEIVDRLEKLL